MPKPSVPEFTLRYIDNSYITTPTTTGTTDPYTGQVTTSTAPGKYVENKSVQVIITNPPFTSYKDENGIDINLYYQVFFKGHFEDVWSSVSQYPGRYNLYNSDSALTVIPVPVYNISEGGQVDVKVMALTGKFVTVYDPPVAAFPNTSSHEEFIGEASEWSAIQTITIPDGASKTTDTPATPNTSGLPQESTVTPLQPDVGSPVLFSFDLVSVVIVALLAAVAVLLVFVVVFLRRRK